MQESTKTFADNNNDTELQNTPEDPKINNPKNEKSESDHLCQTKTPVYLSTPVKVYDDAEKSKLEMLNFVKNFTIIYMFFNKVTGKVYIGSAIDGKARLSRYYIPSVLKGNSRIYKNILKYGHKSFSISILE